MAFRISKLISLRSSSSSSRLSCSPSARNISAVHSTNHRHHHLCPSTRNILATTTNLPTHHHQQQVRYHRTDYEGPGKYGERETGSMFGGEQHDHSHEHQDTAHHQNQKDILNEGEKEQLQQLLKVRYNRRSGSYSHRGYTIGIGGPGKDILFSRHNIDIKYVYANDSLLISSTPHFLLHISWIW